MDRFLVSHAVRSVCDQNDADYGNDWLNGGDIRIPIQLHRHAVSAIDKLNFDNDKDSDIESYIIEISKVYHNLISWLILAVNHSDFEYDDVIFGDNKKEAVIFTVINIIEDLVKNRLYIYEELISNQELTDTLNSVKELVLLTDKFMTSNDLEELFKNMNFIIVTLAVKYGVELNVLDKMLDKYKVVMVGYLVNMTITELPGVIYIPSECENEPRMIAGCIKSDYYGTNNIIHSIITDNIETTLNAGRYFIATELGTDSHIKIFNMLKTTNGDEVSKEMIEYIEKSNCDIIPIYKV